jgi:hypothetical protein
LKKGSSNKKVISKNISKFARPVFLRPVFRPAKLRGNSTEDCCHGSGVYKS